MSKLFSLEDDSADYGYVKVEATPESQLEEDSDNVAELVNEYSNDLSMVTEGFKTASGELNLVTDMKCNLEGKKLSSVDYFTSVENYNLTMKHIADNLGVKLRVPSLEDFKNPYGAKASHAIAIEGFYDFIKKIWEKIKDFFSSFFKKIALFFKRLVNADLDLKSYEEYVDDMIHTLKRKNATLKDNTNFDSKLPSLLADEGMNSIDNNYIISLGVRKIDNLSQTSNKLFSSLNKITSVISGIVKDINSDNLSDTKTKLESVFTTLFQHRFELNDLPDITYDKVMSAFSEEIGDKSSNMLLQSYVNTRDKYEVLPKNFNMYLVLNQSSKLMLFASSQNNTYAQNTIEPISSLSNIANLFDDYKKFSKTTDINKFSSIVAKSQKDIDDCIKVASTRFTSILENLRKGVASEALTLNGVPITTPDEPEENTSRFKRRINIGNTNPTKVNVTSDSAQAEIDNLFGGHNSNSPIGNSYTSSTPNQSSYVIDKKLIKEVEDTQRYVLNVMYSLQVLLRELSTNLAGTITEVKFQLIKYIYLSCKKYS